MNRALVLIGCLAAAGAVAAYSKHSEAPSEQPPVFTIHVPPPPGPAAPSPVAANRPLPDSPMDRVSLVRELQRELKRVGCYSGEVNGTWTTSSRLGMKSFTDRVNASLPIDDPEDVLLSLVRGHKGTACAAPCPRGETTNDDGRCIVSAKAAVDVPAPADPEPATEKGKAEFSGAVPAAAATAAAVGGLAAVPKPAPEGSGSDGRSRAAAASSDDARGLTRSDKPARYSAPGPRERVYKRRSRRYSNRPRPPRIVRNVLRAFGIR